MRQFNSSKYSEIENMFEIVENSFSSVKTEYHRTQTFLKHNVFFKPDTIVVGYTKEKKLLKVMNGTSASSSIHEKKS